MTKNHLNFVIVGHVDHGKSTLIGRLLFDTGSMPQAKIDEVKSVCEALGKDFEFSYLMDYLEEEREKNITIDTTQTFFKTEQRDYVIIDAPGHKEFLKNMITGTSLAEAAILMVDASEGIREQTKRHAYILSLLDIKQLIVAVNKMDLINYQQARFEEIKQELLNHLLALKLKPNYVIPVSAYQGDFIEHKTENLSWYNGPTILEALDSFKTVAKIKDLPLRLPIQDKYDEITVGQVETGQIAKGQQVMIMPSGLKATVKEIKKWHEEKEQAVNGENIGLILDTAEIKRGDIICQIDKLPTVVDNLKATIFWMSPDGLKTDETFILKLATQEVTAKIQKINKLMDSSSLEIINRTNEIKETEVAEVEVKTEQPLVIESFNYLPQLGRFVIVKNEDIAAGGIINLND
jgi:sulfate adenylyltransferase large subunit